MKKVAFIYDGKGAVTSQTQRIPTGPCRESPKKTKTSSLEYILFTDENYEMFGCDCLSTIEMCGGKLLEYMSEENMNIHHRILLANLKTLMSSKCML